MLIFIPGSYDIALNSDPRLKIFDLSPYNSRFLGFFVSFLFQATVCQVCGDRGFEEALVYCDSCKIAALHW